MEWWLKKNRKENNPFSKRDKHQKFYQSTAWQRLRLYVLSQHPLCVDCLALGHTVAGEEVDHKISLTEDYSLRLDYDNLQPLCKPHHSSKTANEVRERKKREQNKLIDESMTELNEF